MKPQADKAMIRSEEKALSNYIFREKILSKVDDAFLRESKNKLKQKKALAGA